MPCFHTTKFFWNHHNLYLSPKLYQEVSTLLSSSETAPGVLEFQTLLHVSTLLSSSETPVKIRSTSRYIRRFHTTKFFWNLSWTSCHASLQSECFHTTKFFWNVAIVVVPLPGSPRFHTTKFFWNGEWHHRLRMWNRGFHTTKFFWNSKYTFTWNSFFLSFPHY